MKKTLDTRQESFCKNAACGMSGTQAAVKAGYSERSAASIASRLLKREDIKERISALVADAAGTLGISPIKVLSGVKEIYERCMQAEPVKIWDSELKEYVDSGEWQFNAKGALKASELFMKYLKMFNSDVNATLAVQLSEEERALLKKLEARKG